jgi:SP family general alpha glucoside:H+ symporter-like MFS transporter
MLNPTAWNWGAKTGFFWAGFCFLSAVWVWFEMPETKGRTYAELDVLFANKVRARKFRLTEVDVFNAEELIDQMGKDGVRGMVENTENEIKTTRV